MSSPILTKIITSPRIPTLPAVAAEILELTRQSGTNLDQVAKVILKDQALASKVLRTVNSSYYGLAKPCGTIRQAMVYLGLNTVKSLVLGFSLIDSVGHGSGGDHSFNYEEYWRRGLFAAVGAREIAAHAGIEDQEEAFLAALMQDVGMVAMYRVLGQDYLDCVTETAGRHTSLPMIEQRCFGVDHAQAGAELVRRWRLPMAFVDAVRCHHNSSLAPADSLVLSQIVELGAQAAAVLSDGQSDAALDRFYKLASEWFSLGPSVIEELLSTIAEASAELASLFHVQIGAAPSIDAIRAQAEEAFIAHQAQVARQADSLRQTHAYLTSLALRDPLTSVANRRGFDLQLARQFEQAVATGGCLGLIFADADGLKPVNDTHGHQIGDMMLVKLAQRMKSVLGDAGEVCRYGGDEFAIILPGADCVAATRAAEKLRQALAGVPIVVQGAFGGPTSLTLTMSWGVAALERSVRGVLTQPSMLVRLADEGVYAAKAAGGNCVRVFSAVPRDKQAA